MYKQNIVFDLSDLSGKLRELCEEYAEKYYEFTDCLVPFYYIDYLDSRDVEHLEFIILKEVYTTYPELLGKDFFLNIWWD